MARIDRAPWLRRAIVVAVLAAMISPALRNRDSAPLSTYPMYASTRPRVVTLHTAVGVDANGAVRRLSMAVIAATDDPLIAHERVRSAIASGAADVLCTQIARRARAVARIEVVSERHDVIAWTTGDADALVERSVAASCPVTS